MTSATAQRYTTLTVINRELSGCWGERVQILQEWLQNEKCTTHLTMLKKKFEAIGNEAPRSYHIVLLCRSGRHRSIAQARITSWCLKSIGLTVADVQHLHKHDWGNLCTDCDSCGSNRSVALKAAIRIQAINVFNNI